jgi:hypothetical protein
VVRYASLLQEIMRSFIRPSLYFVLGSLVSCAPLHKGTYPEPAVVHKSPQKEQGS